MVIFHSYVSLPEGKDLFLAYQWIFIPYIDLKAFFGLMAKDGTQRDGSVVTPVSRTAGNSPVAA